MTSSLTPSGRPLFGWAGSIEEFRRTESQLILECLQSHAQQLFAKTDPSRLREWQDLQTVAWRDELTVLDEAFRKLVIQVPESKFWGLILEYELPQQSGRRPDVIVLAGSTICVLEFKMKSTPELSDIDQLRGYIRDIGNYHSVAHSAEQTVGAIVATKSRSTTDTPGAKVLSPIDIVSFLNAHASPGSISIDKWIEGDYLPAPGLLEAVMAQWEFAPPSLRAVAASNIPQAESTLRNIINVAENDSPDTRRIVFVSGTPGAGKTFVGLNLVHDPSIEVPMRFLSGNGPLVQVLNYALHGDDDNQPLVTAMHRYRDHFARATPRENVIVFDEAQRALDQNKMRIKFDRPHSEAHMMLDILTRTPNWGVMVLLVGDGQEIYNGEVGLRLWFDELSQHFSDHNWHLHLNRSRFSDNDPLGIGRLPENVHIHDHAELHLTTSIRTHKAGHVHDWVNAVINADLTSAKVLAGQAREDGFSLYVTRNLDLARDYCVRRFSASPKSRFGLMMASRNERTLAPFGVSAIASSRDVPRWYVDPRSSDRSSMRLRTAATEFQCQGLELDYSILCWSDDMIWNQSSNDWTVREVQTPPPLLENPRSTRLNVYRVLMTRGRDGMTIFVPPLTRLDSSFEAMKTAGAVELL